MDTTDKMTLAREFHDARTALLELAAFVAAGDWGRADPWYGAGVVVTSDPAEHDDGFWRTPEFAVTEHVAELSWLFERARDTVYDLDGYGMWKEEFFGRMAEAVVAAGPAASARTHLGVAVWAAELTLGHISERAFG